MLPPGVLPALLAEEGARRLALAHLEDAGTARSRISNPADMEALHDYRVALRRLRSCLRGYPKEFRSTVTRRTLRRLRRMARGSNRCRDLDVRLAWLTGQLDRAGEPVRPGIAWLIERLKAEKQRARDEMLRRDERLFPPIHDRLADQLSAYRTTIRLDTDLRQRSTAAVSAERVRAVALRLRNRLRRIHGYGSAIAIHRARIAAKHLRYVLEPFAAGVSGGEAVIQRLKALQNRLGDVHDAHLFLEELRGTLPEAARTTSSATGVLAGLGKLMAMVQARGVQAFDSTTREWLEGAAWSFFREVDAVADGIARLVDQQQEPVGEAPSPDPASPPSADPRPARGNRRKTRARMDVATHST